MRSLGSSPKKARLSARLLCLSRSLRGFPEWQHFVGGRLRASHMPRALCTRKSLPRAFSSSATAGSRERNCWNMRSTSGPIEALSSLVSDCRMTVDPRRLNSRRKRCSAEDTVPMFTTPSAHDHFASPATVCSSSWAFAVMAASLAFNFFDTRGGDVERGLLLCFRLAAQRSVWDSLAPQRPVPCLDSLPRPTAAGIRLPPRPRELVRTRRRLPQLRGAIASLSSSRNCRTRPDVESTRSRPP